MSVDLPAGKHKAVRLRNLPQGASMGVAVQSSALSQWRPTRAAP